MNSQSFYFDPRLEWLLSYPVDAVPILAQSYVIEMRDGVDTLKTINHSPQTLIDLLHKIKGSLSMIGYRSLYEKADSLLVALRAHSDVATTEIDSFISELASSIEALEQWCFDSAEVSECL